MGTHRASWAIFVVCSCGMITDGQTVPGQQFTCVANAGTPVVVRTEGISELVGDLLLQCSGGRPVAAGAQVPRTNITVTLNTNVTSRLLDSNGTSEAMLLIDEPGTTTNPVQNACPVVNGALTCPITGTGTGAGVYDGSAARPNLFPGHIAAKTPNQITWLGVPIDAPGTNGVRTIRITNVRANSNGLSSSPTVVPRQILGFVNIGSGSGASVPILYNAFELGRPTYAPDPQNTALTLGACNDVNVGMLNGSGAGTLSGSSFTVSLREGFAQSFKSRFGTPPPDVNTPGPPASLVVPGSGYGGESGFYLPGSTAGQADFGARVLLRFNNFDPGVKVFLPVLVPLSQSNVQPIPGAGGYPGGAARLTTDGPFSAVAPTATVSDAQPSNASGSAFTGYAELGTGSLGGFAGFYEILKAAADAREQVNIPVALAFSANTLSKLPVNIVTATSFGPLDTCPGGTATDIPRFCDTSLDRIAATIYDCGVSAAQSKLQVYGLNPPNPFPTFNLTAPAGSTQWMPTPVWLNATGPALTVNAATKMQTPAQGRTRVEAVAAAATPTWLTASLSAPTTPSTMILGVNPQGLGAGTYNGSVTLDAGTGGSVTIPVALTIAAGPQPVLTAVGVTNAASNKTVAVSPGMLVTIYGSPFGPDQVADAPVTNNRRFAQEVSDTRVFFDGVPSPMIYSYKNQVAAIVPYAVAGHQNTNVVIEYQGLQSVPVTVPVAESAPALFTLNETGSGQAAALNQDNSVNGPSKPAHVKDVMQFWATGEGVTDPAGTDGLLALDNNHLPKPVLPVSVKIGGLDAVVKYAGAAPTLTAGVIQINAQIPDGVSASDSVPVSIKIGNASSPDGVTIAVH